MKLHKNHTFCIIQDEISLIWYRIYHDTKQRSSLFPKSMLIFEMDEDEEMQIDKFHIGTTKKDLIIYNGILFFLNPTSEYILLFSLEKASLVAKYKTDICRSRSATYLIMNKRIFDSHYISHFAALPIPNEQLASDIYSIIDNYVDNQHWKHEICIFPRFILVNDDEREDQQPIIVNLLQLMESLQYLCLIDS